MPSVVFAPQPIIIPEKVFILGNTLKAVNNPITAPKMAILTSLYGFDNTLYDLILCESGGREDVWGDNFTSYGILQFKKSTYYLFCQGDWQNPQNQISCAKKMIDMGLGEKPIGWQNCWIKIFGK